jgi:hypothetical protein
VVCSSDLVPSEAAQQISALLEQAVQHFKELPADKYAELRLRNGKEHHHFIVEDKEATELPGARMAIEQLRLSLADTLFAATDYKVVGLALVFRRLGKAETHHHAQHARPSPGPARRPAISLTEGRTMEYSRMVDDKLVPLQLPDGFAAAQVIGQSALAAGATGQGDLYHGRINSPVAAGA